VTCRYQVVYQYGCLLVLELNAVVQDVVCLQPANQTTNLTNVMVLKILDAVASTRLFSEYLVHIVVAITVIFVANAFAQGRSTTRERDLHARVILITVGYITRFQFLRGLNP
jgi:hypothetical protein